MGTKLLTRGTGSLHNTRSSSRCRCHNNRPRPTGTQEHCWRLDNSCRSSGCDWGTRQTADPSMHTCRSLYPSQDCDCCNNRPHPSCILAGCLNHGSVGHSSIQGWDNRLLKMATFGPFRKCRNNLKLGGASLMG